METPRNWHEGTRPQPDTLKVVFLLSAELKPGFQASRIWIPALAVFWAFSLAVGMYVAVDYQNRPGEPGHPPAVFPDHSRLKLSSTSPTLIINVHPHCPCTRASLEELGRVVARASRQPQIYALFLRPEEFPPDWIKTDLYVSALLIPNMTVLDDYQGEETKRFGSATSGQVYLYEPDGRLVFSGGITGSRGHAGDNSGAEGVAALLRDEHSPGSVTPRVFGCPLQERGEAQCPTTI